MKIVKRTSTIFLPHHVKGLLLGLCYSAFTLYTLPTFTRLHTLSITVEKSHQLGQMLISPPHNIPKHVQVRGVTDTETGMLPGIPGSAMCVQRFDDSLSSAIRITYRISLRSSSLQEPRYPLLKDIFWLFLFCHSRITKEKFRLFSITLNRI